MLQPDFYWTLSENESAIVSKGEGKNIGRMNVNPIVGLCPLVMTLRLKELSEPITN